MSVQLRARAQGDGQAGVGSGLVDPAELAEALGDREVGPRRGRVDFEELREDRPGPLELAAVVVRPTERLEDRALARLRPRSALEHDCGLGMVAPADQRLAPLEQAVDALALVILVRPTAMNPLVVHGPDRRTDVANGRPYGSRHSARATGRSLGLSVRPGIRPRFAIGRPSISLMSPVKSIGVAPLMYDPTANESTGAPWSLK